jgi:hypothetical protein
MKIRKRFSIIFTAVMIISLVFVGIASAKPTGKVEICHKEGNGSFHLISVNVNALQDHLAHGDAVPGATVPGQGGVLGADCSITSSSQVQPPTLPLPRNNGKKADKVDVCHRTGNGTFILININRNALPAHINNHGDGLPNGEVPNTDKFFRADCSISDVPQKERVETLTVPSKPASGEVYVPVESSTSLLSGQKYELEVSGTYTYNPNNDWADAEYFQHLGAPIKGDTLYPLTPNILDLSINSCSTNTDWGSYQSSHVYTMQYMGTGSKISFCIYDSYYPDNNGALTVEIWKINW